MLTVELILVVFVGVMADGTVPDTAGVERPATGIYAKNCGTKTKEKSENIVKSRD